MKILYTPPRGLGDMIFSLPLLHSLNYAYPGVKIYVPIPNEESKVEMFNLVGFLKKPKKCLPLPYQDSLARQRWQASSSGNRQEKNRLEKLIFEKYLAGETFDLALIPKPFTIDTISCSKQITEDDLKQSGLQIPDMHMVDRFLCLAKYLGIPIVKNFTLDFNKNSATRLISGQKVDTTNPYLVMLLGTSLGKKKWTTQGYRDLADWCKQNNYNVVLIGTGEEYNSANQIAKDNKRVINTVPSSGYSINLENFARLASSSLAVVSPDTGLLHLADASGAIVIGLYGPTSPIKFGPYQNLDNVVSRNDSDEIVQNIKSSEVIKKLEEALKNGS